MNHVIDISSIVENAMKDQLIVKRRRENRLTLSELQKCWSRRDEKTRSLTESQTERYIFLNRNTRASTCVRHMYVCISVGGHARVETRARRSRTCGISCFHHKHKCVCTKLDGDSNEIFAVLNIYLHRFLNKKILCQFFELKICDYINMLRH